MYASRKEIEYGGVDMSDYIGKKVLHKKFGEGIITEFDGTHVAVEFPGDVRKFQYPAAFEKFLTFEDEKLQATAIDENDKLNVQIEEEKQKKRQEMQMKFAATHEQFKPKTKKVTHVYDGVKLDHIKQGDSFDKIVDAINACLGRGYSGYQQAWVKLDDEYGMWFPKMAIVEGNAYVAQSEESGWINTMDETGDYIFETNSDLVKLAEVDEYKHMKRLVFAKFEGGPYVFMGVYERDEDQDSSFKGRQYVRVALETNLSWS